MCTLWNSSYGIAYEVERFDRNKVCILQAGSSAVPPPVHIMESLR